MLLNATDVHKSLSKLTLDLAGTSLCVEDVGKIVDCCW